MNEQRLAEIRERQEKYAQAYVNCVVPQWLQDYAADVGELLAFIEALSFPPKIWYYLPGDAASLEAVKQAALAQNDRVNIAAPHVLNFSHILGLDGLRKALGLPEPSDGELAKMGTPEHASQRIADNGCFSSFKAVCEKFGLVKDSTPNEGGTRLRGEQVSGFIIDEAAGIDEAWWDKVKAIHDKQPTIGTPERAAQRIGEAVADPGPCDVWCYAGKDGPGETVHCRTHDTTFVSPAPCPAGRTAKITEAARQAGLKVPTKQVMIDEADNGCLSPEEVRIRLGVSPSKPADCTCHVMANTRDQQHAPACSWHKSS